GIAEPLRGRLLRIKLRATIALQAGASDAFHDFVLRLRQVVESRFGRNFAGDGLADVLPPKLGELRIVGNVQARRGPILDSGPQEELDQATVLRAIRVVERLVVDGALADERPADMGLLEVHRSRSDELPVKPSSLGPIQGDVLEEGPGAFVPITGLHARLPIRPMRRRRHPPERLARRVHRMVALALRLEHGGGKRRVPEDLLRDVAFSEAGQGLIEVHAERTGRRVFTQPVHVLAKRVLGGRAVDIPASSHAGAHRSAAVHADTPLVDRIAVRYADVTLTGHTQPVVGEAPAEIGGLLAVVHVTEHGLAVDLLYIVFEELSDVLVGRPVERNAQFIAVLLLEFRLQVWSIEPVLAEPVHVDEGLVWQLPE